jgi:hypothetical protein
VTTTPTPPSRSRGPSITFVLPDDDVAAVDAILRDFVRRLVRQYAHLWPARLAVGVRSATRPWPLECWEHHPGLVAILNMLMHWHDDLAAGRAKGGWIEAHEWLQCLRNEIAVSAHTISETCCNGHVADLELPRPEPEREAPVAPPLPGQDVPVRPAPQRTPQPDPWTAWMGTARSPLGPAQERDPVER